MNKADRDAFEKIFTPEIRKEADSLVARYEHKRAAILMILRLIQDRHGFVGDDARKAVAGYLDLPEIDVQEVLTFYTLFHQKPQAKTAFHVCRTLSCQLRGGADIARYLSEKLGVPEKEITADGKFSFDRVECLGACEHAPVLQVNEGRYVGNLTPEKIDSLIRESSGKPDGKADL
jgi:NADH-quinone oxidoreductase E subunit